jgi:hypothetical protein
LADPPDPFDRAAKAIEIASTYEEVLIGLASGLIFGVLAVYTYLLPVSGFNFDNLRISLICFGLSIFGGLFGLQGLVTTTPGKDAIPTDSLLVRIPVIVQLVTFGLGTLFMLLSFPY